MNKYNSIPYWNEKALGKYIYAFDKLDGSNIRIEWDIKNSKKSRFTNGFVKFGTRNRMILNTDDPFHEAVVIFKNKFSERLNEVFRKDEKYKFSRKITIYLEYFGENSFAGLHDEKDEKDLVLFDVFRFQKGFVQPKEFIEDFKDFDIPKLIYKGILSEEFINDIWLNKYNLKEGVIAKCFDNNKIEMYKIKTAEWLKKVKDKMGISSLNEELMTNPKLANNL